MVGLSTAALYQFDRFSLYNSPYPAHDRGRAIDLYPGPDRAVTPSPIAGTVDQIRQTRAPRRPDAETDDYLIVVDTGSHKARLLHVDPAVTEGEAIAVGDHLGRLIDSGYFAPWVGPHVHLGFRPLDAEVLRARGSLELSVPVSVQPLSWDGTGTVIDTYPTHVVIDGPAHPEPGSQFVGVAGADGRVALDGGLPHYAAGGAFPSWTGPLRAFGTVVGDADGRTVTWRDVTVRLDGNTVKGLSLTCGQESLPITVVCPGHSIGVGDTVSVSVASAATQD